MAVSLGADFVDRGGHGLEAAGGLEELLGKAALDVIGFVRQVLAGARKIRDILLELRDPLLCLDELVEDGDARHHREAVVADLAETLLEAVDRLVVAVGEPLQVRLLARLARHAVLPAVDLDIHLGHGAPYFASTARTVSMASTSRRETSAALSSSRLARALCLSSSIANFWRSEMS